MKRKTKKRTPWHEGRVGSSLRGVWWWTESVRKQVERFFTGLVAVTTLGMLLLVMTNSVHTMALVVQMLSLCSYMMYRAKCSKMRHFFEECGVEPDHAWRLIREWRRCANILPDQALKSEYQWQFPLKPIAKPRDDGTFEVRYGTWWITGTNHVLVANAGRWLIAADQAQQDAANRIASHLIDLGFSIETVEGDMPWSIKLTWPKPLNKSEPFRAVSLSSWETVLKELPELLATHEAAEKAVAERAARKQESDSRAPKALADMERILGEPLIPATGLSQAASGEINDASLSAADKAPSARLTGDVEVTQQPVNA